MIFYVYMYIHDLLHIYILTCIGIAIDQLDVDVDKCSAISKDDSSPLLDPLAVSYYLSSNMPLQV
jgi:hypothetical protein